MEQRADFLQHFYQFLIISTPFALQCSLLTISLYVPGLSVTEHVVKKHFPLRSKAAAGSVFWENSGLLKAAAPVLPPRKLRRISKDKEMVQQNTPLYSHRQYEAIERVNGSYHQ